MIKFCNSNVQCALWGNQADLSLSNGQAVSIQSNIIEEMETMDEYILANDMNKVYELLKDGNHVIGLYTIHTFCPC